VSSGLSLLHNIRLFLLAAWLGAAIFFSAVVAPGTFGILRTFHLDNPGEIAGALVGHTLTFLNLTGVIVSMIVLVITIALKNIGVRRAFNLQVILVLIIAVATAAGEWVIAARMRGLRAAFRVPIDQIPTDDPGRMAFAALHGYSVIALSVAMIAALIAFFVSSKRSVPERE
jgi:uncharacterized membrane protein YbhN (UPF0104 family)